MSEIQVQSSFQENLCHKFSELFLHQQSQAKVEPPIHSVFFDLKTEQLIIDNEPSVCGDAKPPARFGQHVSDKTPQQLLQDINEKLQLNAARRERFLENVVLKSRRFIDQVQKVRDRLTKRQKEFCEIALSELQDKRQAADKTRERLLRNKMERIQKRLDHVKAVRCRKLTYSGHVGAPQHVKGGAGEHEATATPTPQSKPIKETQV